MEDMSVFYRMSGNGQRSSVSDENGGRAIAGKYDIVLKYSGTLPDSRKVSGLYFKKLADKKFLPTLQSDIMIRFRHQMM